MDWVFHGKDDASTASRDFVSDSTSEDLGVNYDRSDSSDPSTPGNDAGNDAGNYVGKGDSEVTMLQVKAEGPDDPSSLKSSESSRDQTLFEELGLKVGDEVGRYLLLAPLGAGGMGMVFSAFDPELNRKVALKFIRSESDVSGTSGQTRSESRSQLMREAQSMAQLSHPHVVAIYDVGEAQSHVYMAMEMIEGQTLKEWIRAGGYQWWQAVDLLLRAGKGLASAHDAGLVHRDFKPDNVLLGKNKQVCVADFGLVYQKTTVSLMKDLALSSSSIVLPSTTTKQVLGTPSYMSPEQHRGDQATVLSDQFSFCVSLYEALYGVRPFLGRNLKEIAQAIESRQITEPASGHRVPRWLHKIVLRGLSYMPEERFSSMHELLAELEIDHGKVRKRIWSIATVSLLAIAGLGVLEASSDESSHRCRSGLFRAGGLWSGENRTKVQEQFLSSELGYANAAWSHVDTILSQRVHQWREVYTEVCLGSGEEQGQAQHHRDLQLACLNQQTEQMQAFVGLLQSADKKTIERSTGSVDSLPPIDDCLSEELLNNHLNLPSDLRTREHVDELRRKLDRAKLELSLGKEQQVIESLQPLFEEAQPLRYAPILAEISLELAKSNATILRSEQAGRWITTAMNNAERGKNEFLTAEIISVDIFIHGYRLRRHHDVDALIAHGKAHVLRTGNDPMVRANWLSMSGAAYGGSGRMQESEAVLREALEIFERELGPHGSSTLVTKVNLGYTLHQLQRHDEAEGMFRRVIAMIEAKLGRLHPQLRLPLGNLAHLLVGLGRYGEGTKFIDQLIEIAEDSHGVDSINASHEYIRRAGLLYHAGLLSRAAKEWERVIDIFERSDAAHPRLPLYYAAMARAYTQLGNTTEAAIRLSQIDLDRRGPRDGEGWKVPFVAKIELAMMNKDFSHAQEIFQQLAQKGGDIFGPQQDVDGRVNLLAGELEMGQGNPELAYRHYQRALTRAQEQYPGEDNPNRIPFHKALARAEAAMDDTGEN